MRREGFFRDFFIDFGGETQATPRVGMIIPDHPQTVFTSYTSAQPFIDLDRLFSMVDHAVAYAFTWVEVPETTHAFLHVGSDDGIRVWLNGEILVESYAERGWTPDEDWVQVTLPEGRHALLVKCDDMYGAWGFSLRFTDYDTHLHIREQKVSSLLTYTIRPATGQWSRLAIAPATAPLVTDIPIRITGSFVTQDGSYTQEFSSANGEFIDLDDDIIRARKTYFSAYAEGLPTRTPAIEVTLYLDAIDDTLRMRETRVRDLLADPESYLYAQDHQGLLVWLIAQAADRTSRVDVVAHDAAFHMILTQLDTIIGALATNINFIAERRGSFTAAYISTVDRTAYPVIVEVPTDYSPRVPTPLIVFLHDEGETFSRDFVQPPDISLHISLRIIGRSNRGGYVGLSAVDVHEAIRFVQRFYNIDERRVYIVGRSMGGYGALMQAATAPHVFAAVCALNPFSADTPLEALENVPTYLIHGDADLVVPVQYSRAALHTLRHAGCPVVYKELPGVGYRLHDAAALTRPIQWLLNHRAPIAPQEILLTATLPTIKRAYWARLHQRISPRDTARIRARFFTQNELVLSLDNVRHASFDLPEQYVDSDALLSVLVNGHQFEMPAPLPSRIFVTANDDRYTLHRNRPDTISTYGPGSWQALYDGTPLMIVYGTDGSDVRKNAIAACARRLSRWSYIARKAHSATIPIFADTDVTDAMLASHNVILLGGVGENAITARIAEELRTPLTARTVTIGEDRVPLTASGLWLSQDNPFNPTNRIWLWTATRPEFYTTSYEWQNIWAFPAADPPDILIYNCEEDAISIARHFTDEWRIASIPDTPVLHTVLTNTPLFTRAVGETLIAAAGTDMAWIDPGMTSVFSLVEHVTFAEATPFLFPRNRVIVCKAAGETLRTLYEIAPDFLYIPPSLLSVLEARPHDIYTLAMLPRAFRAFFQEAREYITDVTYRDAHIPWHFITYALRTYLDENLDTTYEENTRN